MKCPLITIVVLASLSCAAHSQTSALTSKEQPVHPGTAILDSMGIYAGNATPKQAARQPKAENTPASQTSAQASKQ